MRYGQHQQAVLAYIAAHLREHGCAPTYAEIGRATGIKWRSRVHSVIVALEGRGLISREKHAARSLEVVALPGTVALRPETGAVLGAVRTFLARQGDPEAAELVARVDALLAPAQQKEAA